MDSTTLLAPAPAASAATSQRRAQSVRTVSTLLVGASLALATAASTATVPAAAATTTHYSYSASAYGTRVSVGSAVKSGPSALVSLGCTTNGNLHRSNTTAGLNLAPVAKSGAVSTTADSYASPVKSRATASTAQVNLLNGLVRAGAVKAASSTTRTSTGYQLSASGTTFTSLVVAGATVRADAAPNTRINLSGIGYLVVNEQVKQSGRLTVNGLHLVVTTSNALGVATGTNVTVSQAISGLSGPVAGVLGGSSYGTIAEVGSIVKSGPSFPAYLSCLGTNGAVHTNTGAGVTVGTALKTGTITDTVSGLVNATGAKGETTATVQSANVLNGVIKVTGVKADAHASTNGSTYSVSDSGSRFGSLTVAGHPEIGVNVAANTKVDLTGIGTLYLRRVVRSSHSVSVRMVELVLSNPVNGLAAGTTVRVAVANASAS